MDPAAFFSLLEELAPLRLAETWDNVGLLVEPLKRRELSRVLLTIDLTEAVLDEAIEFGAEAVVSYHPPLFSPLKRLTLKDARERLALKLVHASMYIYSPHTALDVASPGLNDWLAEAFVDTDAVERMKIRALRPIDPGVPRVGQGRLLELEEAISLEHAVQCVKRHLGLTHVRKAEAMRPIRSVALCAGSGSSVLRGVEADLYLSGELGHHDVLAALAAGSHVILTEHSNSERGYLHRLQEHLRARVPSGVELRLSSVDRDPLQTS